MKFAEAKKHLYQDGSLRDVYVLATTERELEAFYDYVRPMIAEGDFYLDGESSPLPATYLEAMMRGRDAAVTLSILVGDGVVNCHFFDDSELELDFRPNDYQTDESWDALSSFLQGLADAMQREVIVTAENTQECVHIRYEPKQKTAQPAHPTAGSVLL
jgi:hypothetical protein